MNKLGIPFESFSWYSEQNLSKINITTYIHCNDVGLPYFWSYIIYSSFTELFKSKENIIVIETEVYNTSC